MVAIAKRVFPFKFEIYTLKKGNLFIKSLHKDRNKNIVGQK